MDGSTTDFPRIAPMGFGEAAEALRAGWPPLPAAVTAFDVESLDPAQAGAMAARYRAAFVAGSADPGEALAGASLVFPLVTAHQALAAARTAAPHLVAGALWLDCNSCAPATKLAAANVIEAAGAAYIDVAVIAPVPSQPPQDAASPRRPGGRSRRGTPQAARYVPGHRRPPRRRCLCDQDVRSVMIKGLEALTAECLLAARRAIYNLKRVMVHGACRAAEMHEVAATLRDLGLLGGEPDLAARADCILAALE